tara:strand:- start:227 stop:955 length:729 start_codon:yes stop_codon:yes gene_type:complete
MAYTHQSKTTNLGSNGEQGSSISAEDIRRIWEGIKWGTKIASEYLYQVSDDYRKFAPINEPGKVRRKTRLFTKASEFFNKKIGELAAGQNLTVISGSGKWYYVSIQGEKGYVLADAVQVLDDFNFVDDVYGSREDWVETQLKAVTYTRNIPTHWVVTQGPNGYPSSTIFYKDTKTGELIYLIIDPIQGNTIESGVYGQVEITIEDVNLTQPPTSSPSPTPTSTGLPAGALVAGAAALFLLSQ